MSTRPTIYARISGKNDLQPFLEELDVNHLQGLNLDTVEDQLCSEKSEESGFWPNKSEGFGKTWNIWENKPYSHDDRCAVDDRLCGVALEERHLGGTEKMDNESLGQKEPVTIKMLELVSL